MIMENEKNINIDQKVKNYLKVLSQYYDSIDLPKINDVNLTDNENIKIVLMRLIDNSYTLTQRYKKLQTQITNLQGEKCQLIKNNTTLNAENLNLERQLEKSQYEVQLLKKKLTLTSIEKESEQERVSKLKSEIIQNNLREKSKQNQLEHYIKREEAKSLALNNKLQKNCGKYISVDYYIASTLEEYRKNEEKYKETITLLQHNNEGLLHEVLNLKEELIFKNMNSMDRKFD